MIFQYLRFICKSYYKQILWILLCLMMVSGLLYSVVISPRDIQKIYYEEFLPDFGSDLARMHHLFFTFQIASLLISLPVGIYGFFAVRTFYNRLIKAQLPWIANMYYRGYAKHKLYGMILLQMGMFSLLGGILGSLYGNVIYTFIIQEAINPLYMQLEVSSYIMTLFTTLSVKNFGIGIGISVLLSSMCIMPQILVIKKLVPIDDLAQEEKDSKKSQRFSQFVLSNKFSILVVVISLILYAFIPTSVNVTNANLIFAGGQYSKLTFEKQMGDYIKSIFPFSMVIKQKQEYSFRIGSYNSLTWGDIPHAYRKALIQFLSRILMYFAALLIVGTFNQMSEIELNQKRSYSLLRSLGASTRDLWRISLGEYGRFIFFGSGIGLLGIFAAQMLIYIQNLPFFEDVVKIYFLQKFIPNNLGWLFFGLFGGYFLWFLFLNTFRIRKTRVQDDFLVRETKNKCVNYQGNDQPN